MSSEGKNILHCINDRSSFRKWLENNAGNETECYVAVHKGRPVEGNVLNYLDAVEEAICFGWIDSTYGLLDGKRMQRFTPRRENAHWTELNKERARRLEKLGLMADAGRKVLPAMGKRSFKMDPEIREILKKNRLWSMFCSFPPLYQRVRIYNLVFQRNRDRNAYEKNLMHLLEETRKGKMYGQWNDYGRLLEYK